MKIFRKILVTSLCLGTSFMGISVSAQDQKALFGELHMHTSWSFDAYIFKVRASPADAYNFAKGGPLTHPLGKTYQLTRPLDFLAVTDHAVYLGVMAKMADKNHPYSKVPLAARLLNPDQTIMMEGFHELAHSLRTGEAIKEISDINIQRDTWGEMIKAANDAYEPGKFTSLIGFEWTSTPDGENLHRNIIFKGDSAPLPFSVLQSTNPEDLWTWMDHVRAQGHDLLAIPHNSNLSDGRMFERQDSSGRPFTAEYASQRMRNEPLVEVTQVKGTSETHPMLSPNDEFADFELLTTRIASKIPLTGHAGSYVRDAYRTGLEFQDTQGFNPYQFGLIGSTDSHTGISPIEENNYSGKIGVVDGSASQRLLVPSNMMDNRQFSASGLAAVWATENTREAIYGALERKETWATSGPRISLRFFAGFDMTGIDPAAKGWVDKAYRQGVPMGGALKALSGDKAPTFVIWAMKDPEGAKLDRIQIIKGWPEEGVSQEKIYDVAWSAERTPDPETGALPPVARLIDCKTLQTSQKTGAVQLQVIWQDPDFNAAENAFYYVRVLEVPTARWNMYDARELAIENPADLPETIQERAYSSPIWYHKW